MTEQQSVSLADPRVRRALTRDDPLAFAQLYLRPAISDQHGDVSFAECHREWAEIAKTWMRPVGEPRDNRHAFLAPRETGKSTWWLKILPLWAAAHGHVKFAAFFADTYAQAQQHATTFRRELETNDFLRNDFPELCSPGRTPTGMLETNTKELLIRANGFVLTAKGMDSGALGMKVGDRRPDLLLLDDIEPDEANYSGYQADKRLGTIRDAVLPLNIRARVVISGTVTMPDSVTHQLIKAGQGVQDSANEWVREERITVHHALPILTNDDGTRRSQWPEKWPLEFLESIEHTRQYSKNYANDPFAVDSDYWSREDFTYGTFPTTRTLLSVDPAVSTGSKSDFTGLSVVSYAPAGDGLPERSLVEHVEAVKLVGAPLRRRVEELLQEFPHIGRIVVEANQGGDMWLDVLRNLPVRVVTFSVKDKKEVRAGKLLHHYQAVPSQVVHAKRLPAFEAQCIAFPKAPNDDMVDSVGNGVRMLLKQVARLYTPWEQETEKRGTGYGGARTITPR